MGRLEGKEEDSKGEKGIHWRSEIVKYIVMLLRMMLAMVTVPLRLPHKMRRGRCKVKLIGRLNFHILK